MDNKELLEVYVINNPSIHGKDFEELIHFLDKNNFNYEKITLSNTLGIEKEDEQKLAYDIAMNYVDSGRLWFDNAIKAMIEFKNLFVASTSNTDETSVVSHPSTFCNSIEQKKLVKQFAKELALRLQHPFEKLDLEDYERVAKRIEKIISLIRFNVVRDDTPIMLNSEQGDAVSDTSKDASSNADGSIINEAGNKNTVQSAEEPIPDWIIKYDKANHQSSAGKAIRFLMERLQTKESIIKGEKGN